MEKFYMFLGNVIAVGGGAAVIAYVILSFLGKKWIDSKFDERFEEFKQKKELELESYRQQVNLLYNRAVKIHDKEIDLLPEIWRKLVDTLGSVVRVTSPYQQYPNLQMMSEEQFNEFLSKSRLSTDDKNKLITAENRQDFYIKLIFWYDLEEARSEVFKFHNFMLYNRVLLSKEIKIEFEAIDNLMLSALNVRVVGEHTKDWKEVSSTINKFIEDSKNIVDRIEALIQDRLEFSKANTLH